MELTVLGSGTTIPDPERGPAGFLLRAGGSAILIDGGSGSIKRLAAAGVDARDLDGGVYSHRHVDHCGDLVPLLFTLRVGGDRPRQRDYPIWAGEGFADFLQGLRGVYGHWLEGSGWGATVTELSTSGPDAAALPGGVRLETLPANHSAGALHRRFIDPEGRVLVFSGDTGPSDGLRALAAGADLLICECADDGPTEWGGHLWPEAVAELVAAARPRQVALTHFYPGTDPRRAIDLVGATGVPVLRAEDLQVFRL